MPSFQGAIFDVDGVRVDSPHERAWREALSELLETSWRDLRTQSTWSSDAFSSLVYQQEVSGKPRAAGARAALAHFGLPDDDDHVAEYGRRKQAMIDRLIDDGEFDAHPDGLRFALALRESGIRLAAASSSKNARRLLERVGLDGPDAGTSLADIFDVDVSGRDFARGKPDPEMFLTAAAELGVDRAAVVVVEDAAAGVRAAKAGGMAAIAVARGDDAALLDGAGADLIVTSLDQVDRTAFHDGRLASEPTAEAL
jgi:beta-phosphoglucomutase-like phosphatase (HAD superfamily)